jgi:hypothetical protein
MSADATPSLDDAASGVDGRPSFLVELDTPAVRVETQNKQHRPDWTADEPQPACGADIPDHRGWIAEERDESGRDQCHHQNCWGTPRTMDGGPARHVQKAAADDHQLDLDSPRWSQ